LILKAENTPRIGAQVVDDTLKSVGKVFDVIGPVSSPYAVIRPGVNVVSEHLVSSMLYTAPSSRRRKEKRRYGR
jgi:RNA-binding protein